MTPASIQAPAVPVTPILQRDILEFARLFEPKRCVGYEKVRVGRDFDGGYILLDDFSGVDGALSFGVADDPSWDLQMAQRGIPVHQFDDSIEAAPADHPLITFHKLRLGDADGPGSITLNTAVALCLPQSRKPMLKIDIEGSEWPVFAAAPSETLGRFSQIVCEFHGFHLLADPGSYSFARAVMTKLKSLFEIVHIHGNNAHPFVNLANVTLPRLLEVSFARRSHYRFADTDEIFPTPLDQPNLPDRPDLHLGCFKF